MERHFGQDAKELLFPRYIQAYPQLHSNLLPILCEMIIKSGIDMNLLYCQYYCTIISQKSRDNLNDKCRTSASSENPIKTCLGCGRHDDIHARLMRIEKKSPPKQKTIRKYVGNYDYEEVKPVQRKLNPVKAYNLFSVSCDEMIKILCYPYPS